ILIDKVLSALTRVHQSLGPGLFESVYESATMIELAEINLPAKRQVEIPVRYRGKDVGMGFRRILWFRSVFCWSSKLSKSFPLFMSRKLLLTQSFCDLSEDI